MMLFFTALDSVELTSIRSNSNLCTHFYKLWKGGLSVFTKHSLRPFPKPAICAPFSQNLPVLPPVQADNQ